MSHIEVLFKIRADTEHGWTKSNNPEAGRIIRIGNQRNCNDDGLFCNLRTKGQIEDTFKKFKIDEFKIENIDNEFEHSYEVFLKEDVYQIFKERLSLKN
tara:strand:- start:7054 stop:7350 length:297 start_codon:yes stop_codon:yes gene_type:complete